MCKEHQQYQILPVPSRKDKIIRSSEKNVGAWSAAVLAAILGGTSKPEEETAKNTKEMVRLQRDILKNSVRSESGITYS